MRFFVDQCVPESAARSLEQRGHDVIRLRERIAPDSPDNLVAAISQSNDAILVTMKFYAARIEVAPRHTDGLSCSLSLLAPDGERPVDFDNAQLVRERRGP